jgi:putative endonuclease
MTYQQHVGKTGEALAAKYLEDRGYQIIEQNFTSRYGELDLVARDGDSIVFVEVKTRTSSAFGEPEDSVTPEKLERIINTALLWLQANPDQPDDWRIDVVAILMDHQNQIEDIQHFINVAI